MYTEYGVKYINPIRKEGDFGNLYPAIDELWIAKEGNYSFIRGFAHTPLALRLIGTRDEAGPEGIGRLAGKIAMSKRFVMVEDKSLQFQYGDGNLHSSLNEIAKRFISQAYADQMINTEMAMTVKGGDVVRNGVSYSQRFIDSFKQYLENENIGASTATEEDILSFEAVSKDYGIEGAFFYVGENKNSQVAERTDFIYQMLSSGIGAVVQNALSARFGRRTCILQYCSRDLIFVSFE